MFWPGMGLLALDQVQQLGAILAPCNPCRLRPLAHCATCGAWAGIPWFQLLQMVVMALRACHAFHLQGLFRRVHVRLRLLSLDFGTSPKARFTVSIGPSSVVGVAQTLLARFHEVKIPKPRLPRVLNDAPLANLCACVRFVDVF